MIRADEFTFSRMSDPHLTLAKHQARRSEYPKLLGFEGWLREHNDRLYVRENAKLPRRRSATNRGERS